MIDKTPPEERTNLFRQLDENMVLWGFLSGMVMGGLWWLWRVPRSGAATRAQISSAGQQLREKIVLNNTIADSLAEGKAIAQRHQEHKNRHDP